MNNPFTQEYLDKQFDTVVNLDIQEYLGEDQFYWAGGFDLENYPYSIQLSVNDNRGYYWWKNRDTEKSGGDFLDTPQQGIDWLKFQIATDYDGWIPLGEIQLEKPIEHIGTEGFIFLKEWFDKNDSIYIYTLVGSPADLWRNTQYEMGEYNYLPMWNIVPTFAEPYTDEDPDDPDIGSMVREWQGNRWRFKGNKTWLSTKII